MKVSIIVPVYNSEEYLDDCLNSLLNQTLKEIEIIAIDDASTDNSFSILKAYEQEYPNRITVFHNQSNIGQSASRNIGLSHAKGEYIGFLDSDDYFGKNMLEDMYNGAKKENYPEVITTGLYFVKDNHYLKENTSYFGRGKGRVYYVLDNPDRVLDESPSVCNKLFRRDTLADIKFLEGRMWEDVAFSFSNLFNANRVLVFTNPDYFYRKSATSGVSAKGFKVNPHLHDIFAVADEIEAQTRRTGRYEKMTSQIKFIQIVTCLQRVNEVTEWNIDKKDKSRLVLQMLKEITTRYGDLRNLDFAMLSSKIGILNLEKYQEIIANESFIKGEGDVSKRAFKQK